MLIVCGVAGSGSSRCRPHHALKSSQSFRLGFERVPRLGMLVIPRLIGHLV